MLGLSKYDGIYEQPLECVPSTMDARRENASRTEYPPVDSRRREAQTDRQMNDRKIRFDSHPGRFDGPPMTPPYPRQRPGIGT